MYIVIYYNMLNGRSREDIFSGIFLLLTILHFQIIHVIVNNGFLPNLVSLLFKRTMYAHIICLFHRRNFSFLVRSNRYNGELIYYNI